MKKFKLDGWWQGFIMGVITAINSIVLALQVYHEFIK